MNWKKLETETALAEIKALSEKQPVIIFKHSTRCSVSSMALNRLERNWDQDEMQTVQPYFLDLLSYRNISNKIAEIFGVPHESPQILLIENGKCVYHSSHMGISYDILKKEAKI